MEYPIYLHDLKEEVQQDVLDFYGCEKVENTNFDIQPLAILFFEEDEQ